MNDDREHRAKSIVRVPGRGLMVARASLVKRGLDLIEQPSEVMVWETDGSEMVYIPEGEFPMGITEVEARQWHEEFGGKLEWYMASTPSHRVYVDAFYIGRYPVTNGQYARFVQDTDHPVPFVDASCNWDWKRKTPPPGKENHPVAGVSWYDAQAYCEWAGLRLLTEAEWEKAASWDSKAGRKRVYPWGDEWDAGRCNSLEGGTDGTTPVGAYSPAGDSPYGCADMAGNVSEWVADRAGSYPSARQVNPMGPDSGIFRVLRGGSWGLTSDYTRGAGRGWSDPVYRLDFGGFRCARSS